jgi:S-adenosylmethionine-diacylglycerol 3-amino-3-carboxypropyl transferase
MKSEIQGRADFTTIRYGQCWEDAALLLEAMKPAGRRCVSIGSAGDNSFSLLAAGAEQVTAVEMNPAQVACIELRRAGYLELNHTEFLELLGVRCSTRRDELFRRCRGELSEAARRFWESDTAWFESGPISCGRFESYFRMFREKVLPLAHPRRRVESLLEPRGRKERGSFYDEVWNNRRWRWIFGVFFSRFMMGRLGRDPEFFKYVEGSVADRILERTRHALVELAPAENPYLHWILCGEFGGRLPHALEEGSFEWIGDAIRDGRFAIHEGSLESWLEDAEWKVDAFNLSDIFEYMSEANTASLLERLADDSNPGCRLAYWNMLAPRSRPEELAERIESLPEISEALLEKDRAFFYSRFVVEEVKG